MEEIELLKERSENLRVQIPFVNAIETAVREGNSAQFREAVQAVKDV